MLRAIAGYILGGILNGPPEETLECETKEVNDWLVVNMPDKPEENDLDFDTDTESVVDDDEDDVLTCLPMLMTSDELICDRKPLFGKKIPTEEELRQRFVYSPQQYMRRQEFMENYVKPEQIILHYQDYPNMEELSFIFPNDPQVLEYRQNNNRPITIVESYYSHLKKDIAKNITEKYSQDIKEKSPQKKEQQRQSQQKSKSSESNCVYTSLMSTPSYLNHRPLAAAAAKTDLLQQIKELEPSQKAKEIALKKHNSRSQLNRQNKNYIYCSSNKTTKRKDLQRNHSGANNNRRC